MKKTIDMTILLRLMYHSRGRKYLCYDRDQIELPAASCTHSNGAMKTASRRLNGAMLSVVASIGLVTMRLSSLTIRRNQVPGLSDLSALAIQAKRQCEFD